MSRVHFISGGICALLLIAFGPPRQLQAQCVCPSYLISDIKADGSDVQCFAQCLTSGPGGACPGCNCADANLDSLVDLNDIPAFVNTLLSGSLFCAMPTQYEPGTLETPRASPCSESQCAGLPDRDSIHSVYLFSGEFHHAAVDLRIKGRGLDFIWARKYRSRHGPNTDMGNGWDYSYNIFIEQVGQNLLLHDGNSRQDLYLLRANGRWARDEYFREIELNGDGTYTLTFANNGKWHFRQLALPTAPGRISSIADRNGNTISFSYLGPGGRLSTIQDSLGRLIQIAYNAENRIASVTDFIGRQIVYSYYLSGDADGGAGDLKSVRSPVVNLPPPVDHNNFPAGKTTFYTYSKGFVDDALNHNLLTIKDPKGQTYVVNSYHPTTQPGDLNFDRVIEQQWGDPGDDITVSYTPQVPSAGNNFALIAAAVTNRRGFLKEFHYDAFNRLVIAREYTTGLRTIDPPYFETRWSYNTDALPVLIIHPNLNSTINTYELELNPLAARRSRGNLRQVTRDPGPLGGDPASITESYTYESGFGGCGCGSSFVKSHTDGRGNTTTHSYDAFGNRTQTVHRPGGGMEDWTYNSFGQMETHTHPANGSGHRRIDVYTYYGLADGHQNGYLKSVSLDDPGFSLKTMYEYDDVGNVIKLVAPRGNAVPSEPGQDTFYTYNQLDQVVLELSREAIPGVRYEQRYWYDENENLIRRDVENRDETGALQPNSHFSTIMEYDILNHLIRVCREKGTALLSDTELSCPVLPNPEFAAEEYEYDANRNQTLVRSGEATSGADPDNQVQTIYDERDLVFLEIRAPAAFEQSTTQYDYDGNRNTIQQTQGLEGTEPRVFVYLYDGYDRRTTATDPMGNTFIYGYDANGNQTLERREGELLDVPGGAGNLRLSEMTYQYDAMDRRIRRDIAHFDSETQVPIGDGLSTTQWFYSDISQVVQQFFDLPGHQVNYTYDTANRTSVVRDAKNNTATYSYDANSNALQVVELDKSDLGTGFDESFTTTYQYDALDRRVFAQDNVGNTQLYEYDSRSNRTRYTDARGNQTRYHYDGLSRLVRTVRDMDMDGPDDAFPGDGNPDIMTTQTWDDSSNLTSQTDDNGNTTQYQYDALDRRTGIDYADCTSSSILYDVHDNAVSMTDANGTQVDCQYDGLNRLTFKNVVTFGTGVIGPPLGTGFESYQYDGLSRMIRAEDDDSIVTRGSAITSGYDSLSAVLRETQEHTNPPAPPRLISAVYDGEVNQTRLNYPGGRAIVRTYDTLDRPLIVRDDPPGPGTTLAVYRYIGPYRVQRRDYPNGGGAQLVRMTCLYDGDRRIREVQHVRDPAGTPVALDHRLYNWDPNNNRAMADNLVTPAPPDMRIYAYDAADRLIRTDHVTPSLPPATEYILDGVGNREQVHGAIDPGPYAMDSALCIPGDFQMNQYSATAIDPQRLYDDNGNLIDINFGASTFSYDYRNRLGQYASPGSGTTAEYRYDCLGRRIAKDVNGVVTHFYYDGVELIEEQDAAGATSATYVYSKGLDRLLQMKRAGQAYFYHEDDLGSVIKVSDSSGDIVEGYAYADFGEPQFFDQFGSAIAQSLIDNPRLFTGYYFDHEAGLYHSYYRYFSPTIGRFISPDPIGIWGDEFSLGSAFTYCGNSPTTRIDPFGDECTTPAQTALCSLVAGVAAVVGARVGGEFGGAVASTVAFEACCAQFGGTGGALPRATHDNTSATVQGIEIKYRFSGSANVPYTDKAGCSECREVPNQGYKHSDANFSVPGEVYSSNGKECSGDDYERAKGEAVRRAYRVCQLRFSCIGKCDPTWNGFQQKCLHSVEIGVERNGRGSHRKQLTCKTDVDVRCKCICQSPN